MADRVFNIAKGAVVRLVEENPNALQIILLKEAEADNTLKNHAHVDALLTAAGNTEADFTGYARKTGITGTIDVDNTANVVTVDIPDQEWENAGNGTNNTLVKAVICVQTGATDETLIPLTFQDFSLTTDGSTFTVVIHDDGFFRAQTPS
jgi:hypothetical protein